MSSLAGIARTAAFGQTRQRRAPAQHSPSGLRAVARAAAATSAAAGSPPRKRAPRLRRGRPCPGRGMSPIRSCEARLRTDKSSRSYCPTPTTLAGRCTSQVPGRSSWTLPPRPEARCPRMRHRAYRGQGAVPKARRDVVAPESLRVRLRRCTPRGSATTGGGLVKRSLAIRRQKMGAAMTGASITGASVVGPRLLGPSAMAPLAIAASAVGALAIGRLAIADAVIRKLRAEEIEIGSLKVRELEVAGQRWPGRPPPSTA